MCEHTYLLTGGTVVEGTAGNTGIGLAHVCNALGYKCVIYMPDTQSKVSTALVWDLAKSGFQFGWENVSREYNVSQNI